MPEYSAFDRERAELNAIRVAVLTLLEAIEVVKPGTLAALKKKATHGAVKPMGDFLPVKDALLRERILALVSEISG